MTRRRSEGKHATPRRTGGKMLGIQSSWLLYAVIIALVVGRFLLRELRERRLRLGTVFVLPSIILVLGVALADLAGTHSIRALPALTLATIVAIAVGAGIGLAVGHFTTLRMGPPGYVLVRGSPATVAIWIAALALRAAVRFVISSHDLAALMIANAALVILLGTALGLVRYRILVNARLAFSRGTATDIPAV